MENKKISFIMPSRNNLKYLKWSYNSIRKNLNPEHEICFADDASTDGTWEWMQEIMLKDKNVKAIKNDGPTRLGHTILYDRLINEVATGDIIFIFHADMYAFPGIDEIILKLIKPKTIVTITRIEPPLHPEGPEKIIYDLGLEPENFDENVAMKYVEELKKNNNGKTTDGVFAPWAIYKSDFQYIGGHDPLFAPQEREDSDIFNRFKLAGFEFIQTWDAYVYHLTCRGSRYNPHLTQVGRESKEWLIQNSISERNFIRKWGTVVKHHPTLHPVVINKYKISLVIENVDQLVILYLLEPWFNKIYIKTNNESSAQILIKKYLLIEQIHTKFNLSEKIFIINSDDNQYENDDIILFIDAAQLNEKYYNYIFTLPETITFYNKIGKFKYKDSPFILKINRLNTYQNELIFLNKTEKNNEK